MAKAKREAPKKKATPKTKEPKGNKLKVKKIDEVTQAWERGIGVPAGKNEPDPLQHS